MEVYIDILNNFEEFFNYHEKCLCTLAKENKEIYIGGDFNFDLLKIDDDHCTQRFFVVMVYYQIFFN